ALRRGVADNVAKLPDWGAGKVLLALLELRRGNQDEARRTLVALLDDKKSPMPVVARWVVAQELENYSSMQDLVLRLHEEAVDEAVGSDYWLDLSYSPVRRLLRQYQRAGRREDARALLWKFARTDYIYEWDPNYAAYQKFSTQNSVAREMLQ